MARNYKKILVPLDNSKYSERALDEAILIGKKFGAKLYLLIVVDASPIEPYGMSLSKLKGTQIHKVMQDLVNSAFDTARFILERKAFKCKKAGVDAVQKISTGLAAKSILEFAIKNNIELIILGSQGLGGVKKIKALGSVSRKVSENAQCPVMLIH